MKQQLEASELFHVQHAATCPSSEGFIFGATSSDEDRRELMTEESDGGLEFGGLVGSLQTNCFWLKNILPITWAG